MTFTSVRTHLTLGRVSNLPTVWTNVLAAGAVAGASIPSAGWMPLLIAMSLIYIAGMYYNDVCDVEHDREHQPHRPIPAGLISCERTEVFALLYVLVALLLIYCARMTAPLAKGSASAGWLISALILISCIVLYDRHHKNNPYSPLVMAACRISVLTTTAYTLTGSLPALLLIAIAATLCWLIGLTYLAKHEQRSNALMSTWPVGLLLAPTLPAVVMSITSPAVLLPMSLLIVVVVVAGTRLLHGPAKQKGSAIALFIAGISLVDGIFLASLWGLEGALYSILAFGLTLALQRWIAGT